MNIDILTNKWGKNSPMVKKCKKITDLFDDGGFSVLFYKVGKFVGSKSSR